MFIHMLDKGTWKLFWSCYAEKNIINYTLLLKSNALFLLHAFYGVEVNANNITINII